MVPIFAEQFKHCLQPSGLFLPHLDLIEPGSPKHHCMRPSLGLGLICSKRQYSFKNSDLYDNSQCVYIPHNLWIKLPFQTSFPLGDKRRKVWEKGLDTTGVLKVYLGIGLVQVIAAMTQVKGQISSYSL